MSKTCWFAATIKLQHRVHHWCIHRCLACHTNSQKLPIINVSTPFFSVTAPFCLGNNSTKQGYSHKITYGICMCFHVARQYVHTVYKTANINTCLKSDSFLRMELARSFAPYMQFLLMSSPFRTFRFVAMQVTGRLRLCSVYSYLQTSKKPSKL